MISPKVPNWFHYSCFFKKIKATSASDIAGVDSLRWEDQEKIKKNVGESAKSGAAPSTTTTTKEDKDLIAEYAKSSRSSCKGCGEKIEKVWQFSTLEFKLFTNTFRSCGGRKKPENPAREKSLNQGKDQTNSTHIRCQVRELNPRTSAGYDLC